MARWLCQPPRWSMSTESSQSDSRQPLANSLNSHHDNVDIRKITNIILGTDDGSHSVRVAEDSQFTPEWLAGSPSREEPVPTTSTEFSRPLTGRPGRHVAIGLVNLPQESTVAQLINNFPPPPQMTARGNDIPRHVGQDVEPFLHNDIQPRRISPVEVFLTAHNIPSNVALHSHDATSKLNGHLIKRKPVPQRTISPNSQRYSPYPDPRAKRLAKGSLEGLIRYRKLEKGELTPLPEIKRVSTLMLSFEVFGLVDTQNETRAAADDVSVPSPDAVSSGHQEQQPADHGLSEIAKGRQRLKGRGDGDGTAVLAPAAGREENLITFFHDDDLQPHPHPLHSNAAAVAEQSYARYLANGGVPPPIPPRNPRRLQQVSAAAAAANTAQPISWVNHITTEVTQSRGTESSTDLSSGSQARVPSFPSSPLAQDTGFSPPDSHRFNPLTEEDTPPTSPRLQGEGSRYPAFYRWQEHRQAASVAAAVDAPSRHRPWLRWNGRHDIWIRDV